ncbi:hypothetical protein BS78_K103200 [Paspalum vaginatum]|uniref:Uncharacterized protein n=1 Tax=Paspalum vaginatum TaxID=158149 RepID=A0A9W7X816_9POAL|nr:hypothetical protein BS78_K103200 [Paspalum vaginatum]
MPPTHRRTWPRRSRLRTPQRAPSPVGPASRLRATRRCRPDPSADASPARPPMPQPRCPWCAPQPRGKAKLFSFLYCVPAWERDGKRNCALHLRSRVAAHLTKLPSGAVAVQRAAAAGRPFSGEWQRLSARGSADCEGAAPFFFFAGGSFFFQAEALTNCPGSGSRQAEQRGQRPVGHRAQGSGFLEIQSPGPPRLRLGEWLVSKFLIPYSICLIYI